MVPFFVAESEGFKPPIPERGIPDFESSAFGHSANLPIKQVPTSLLVWPSMRKVQELNLPFHPFAFAHAKVVQIFQSTKLITNKSQEFSKTLAQLLRLALTDGETYLTRSIEGL